MERKMSDKTEELKAYWVVSVRELERLIEESKQNWRALTGTTRVKQSHCLVLRFEDCYAGKERPAEMADEDTQLRRIRRY